MECCIYYLYNTRDSIQWKWLLDPFCSLNWVYSLNQVWIKRKIWRRELEYIHQMKYFTKLRLTKLRFTKSRFTKSRFTKSRFTKSRCTKLRFSGVLESALGQNSLLIEVICIIQHSLPPQFWNYTVHTTPITKIIFSQRWLYYENNIHDSADR